MPYIITTHFTEADECDTSVEAATAEEARELARIAVEAAHRETGQSYDRTWEGWAATDLYIDESGGTIGPLPDGTVIEVRQVDANTPLPIHGPRSAVIDCGCGWGRLCDAPTNALCGARRLADNWGRTA